MNTPNVFHIGEKILNIIMDEADSPAVGLAALSASSASLVSYVFHDLDIDDKPAKINQSFDWLIASLNHHRKLALEMAE